MYFTCNCRHFASPFADGNGTRFQHHLSNGGGATDPAGTATKVLKQSNIPISVLKVSKKVDKFRAMPAYVFGVTPRDGRC